MDKSKLSDEEWVHLIGKLKKTSGIRVGCEATCRRFVEAVLWMLRSGAQWRLLPDRLGRWNSVFKRFVSWSRFDVWENMLAHISAKADLENVCIDSTVVRAHACAAGAANSNAAAEALGRSRGGFGCKIHASDRCTGPARAVHFDGRSGGGHHPSDSPHEGHWQHGRAAGRQGVWRQCPA